MAKAYEKVKITGITKKEVLYNLWSRDPKFNRTTAAKCLGISLRAVQNHVMEFEKLKGEKPQFGPNGSRVSIEEANKIVFGNLDEQVKEHYDPTGDTMNEEQLKEDLDEFKVEADVKPGKTSSTTVFGKTLDEEPSTDDIIKLAISKAGVNPECWDVGQCKVNFWHTSMKVRVIDKRNKNGYLHRVIRVTNWSVRITLIPTRAPFVLHAIRDLIDTIPPIEKVTYKRQQAEQFCGVLSPVDIHFGKFAWNNETMSGHMDLGIAKQIFIDSCMKNLSDMNKYPLSKLYVVVGHDLMHFENYAAETFRGRHHLDVDGRLPKAIKTTKEAFVYIVDQCAQIAPVEIVRVPGNHDMHASYWLVELMRERYRKNKHVTVDNGVYSDSPRKLIKWGNLIVGMMHDAAATKAMRAINAVPLLWRKEWGESRYSELWVGHKHNKQDTKTFPVHTLGGTLIRQLSALTAIDFWHFDELFVDGVPACESFVLDKQDGVVANFKRNIDYVSITEEIEAAEAMRREKE